MRRGSKLGYLVAGVVVGLAFGSIVWVARGVQPQAGDETWIPTPASIPDDGKLRILVLGAHPDDAELKGGGAGAMWAALGHHVKFISLTNGDIGHWNMSGGPLAMRRNAEVQESKGILGISEVEVWDVHDGELMPTLELRRKLVRNIRQWGADLIIGHRPSDYHPDHRYVGVLMQDAAYMVTVPHFEPLVPYLTKNPVFMFSVDGFERPNPHRGDVVIDIGPVIDKKLNALAALESQFLEGGCCNPQPIAANDADRQRGLERVRNGFARRFEQWANQYRDRLTVLYGPQRGAAVRYAEAFEVCEYGTQPDAAMLRTLFPFEGLTFE